MEESFGRRLEHRSMAQACQWNGMPKNLKSFLKWFQSEYEKLGLTEIRMDGGRFDPHYTNRVILTSEEGKYNAEIGIRTDSIHQTGEKDEIVWTDPRPQGFTPAAWK